MDYSVPLLNLLPAVLTVVIHSLGTMLMVHQRPRLFEVAMHRNSKLLGEFVIVLVLVELVILHSVEIALWAVWFRAIGLLPNLDVALAFAGMSYTTLGYNASIPAGGGDASTILLGMLGMLMFGWSTGILVTTVIRYEKALLHFDAGSGP